MNFQEQLGAQDRDWYFFGLILLKDSFKVFVLHLISVIYLIMNLGELNKCKLKRKRKFDETLHFECSNVNF